jgi:hypothetical protein
MKLLYKLKNSWYLNNISFILKLQNSIFALNKEL